MSNCTNCNNQLSNNHSRMIKNFKRRFFISFILTIPVLILSPLIQQFLGVYVHFVGDKYILFLLSAFIFIYGGWPFLKGFYGELRNKQPGMMTLIALAISVAFFYSAAIIFGLKGKYFFWELVTLIDIMLLGHWVEMRSTMGASRALRAMTELMPSIAHLKTDKGIKDVSVSKLKVGNVILIKAGEKIPADGVIIKGQTSVNEAMVTGESRPINKNKGDKLIGGSINNEGTIDFKVTRAGENSYLSQLINLVEKVQKSKSKTQDLANKAAMWLTIIAISVGLITLFLWLYFGKNFVFSLERMVTVMVITCPHALGLAIPLVVAVSTTLLAKKGLLIRDRNTFENARNIDVIVFDKTGTLTKGDFGVTNIITENGYKKKDVLFYAASLDFNSTHPIAQGIIKKAEEKNIYLADVSNFKSLPGEGVQGTINKKLVKAVGENYLNEKKIRINNKKINELSKEGKTIVYLLLEENFIGAIALADLIRSESKDVIKELKSMNIRCMMLTGDKKEVANWVAKELKLDDYFAEILPERKSKIIKKIQAKGLKVAMVGDGINDAPALTQADIGVAIGAGTDIAIESADIILVKNNLKDIVVVMGLARDTYLKMKQNLLWASGYNAIAIPLAAGALYNLGIILNPAIGAVLMSLSTVIVAVNAQLLRIK